MIDIQKEIEKKFPNMNKKDNFLKKSLFKIAKKIVHEDSINQFLTQNSHLKGFEFVDAVLDYFDFDYTVSSTDLQNIPSSGKVVIIANHPLGGLDALCLLRLIGQVRKDVKIVANDFLSGFEALNSLTIMIDNYKIKQSKTDIKKIYEALNNEDVIKWFLPTYQKISSNWQTNEKNKQELENLLKLLENKKLKLEYKNENPILTK